MVGVLIVIPVVNVFAQALAEGVGVYWKNLFDDPDTRHSIFLTLTVVPIALVANVVFGVAAAWAIARFNFPGRTLLTALIDLPFSVSPVVAGLMFVLIFGLQGYFGPFLRRDGYSIMPYLVALVVVVLVLVVAVLPVPADQPAGAARASGSIPWLVVLVGGAARVRGCSFFLQQDLEVWPREQEPQDHLRARRGWSWRPRSSPSRSWRAS